MRLHPHVHYIVPAVGLNARWRAKRLKDPKFLLPAKPLALRLRTLLSNALLDVGRIDQTQFWTLVKMSWNASVDRAGSGENAVKYLGQYVRRSVISDGRILGIEGDQVRIRIKDRDTGAYESRLIEGVEFLRRFSACFTTTLPSYPLPSLPSCTRQIRAGLAKTDPRCQTTAAGRDERDEPSQTDLSTLRRGDAARAPHAPRTTVSAQRTLLPIRGRMNLGRPIELQQTPLPNERCRNRLCTAQRTSQKHPNPSSNPLRADHVPESERENQSTPKRNSPPLVSHDPLQRKKKTH